MTGVLFWKGANFSYCILYSSNTKRNNLLVKRKVLIKKYEDVGQSWLAFQIQVLDRFQCTFTIVFNMTPDHVGAPTFFQLMSSIFPLFLTLRHTFKIFLCKIFCWLDSTPDSLGLEATAFPTLPLPLSTTLKPVWA